MFKQYQIESKDNLFEHLSYGINFEKITTGRYATNIAKLIDNKIPIVRTTTKYNNPSQTFNDIHKNIIKNIKEISGIENIEFNNALIEIYDSTYKTMKYHSDQALDLADNSYIGIFSVYNDKNTKSIRSLEIKDKKNGNNFKFELKNNSVILFDTTTNSEYLHRIILESQKNNNTKWLGITFRFSKTLISFIDNIPYLPNNCQLYLTEDEKEIKDFYYYRALENKFEKFNYPEINYTISPSDIKPINLV